MKTTFLNRKEAQQRAGLTVKEETGGKGAIQKIKLTNSAFGINTASGSMNEKKMEKLKSDKIIMNEQNWNLKQDAD